MTKLKFLSLEYFKKLKKIIGVILLLYIFKRVHTFNKFNTLKKKKDFKNMTSTFS